MDTRNNKHFLPILLCICLLAALVLVFLFTKQGVQTVSLSIPSTSPTSQLANSGSAGPCVNYIMDDFSGGTNGALVTPSALQASEWGTTASSPWVVDSTTGDLTFSSSANPDVAQSFPTFCSNPWPGDVATPLGFNENMSDNAARFIYMNIPPASPTQIVTSGYWFRTDYPADTNNENIDSGGLSGNGLNGEGFVNAALQDYDNGLHIGLETDSNPGTGCAGDGSSNQHINLQPNTWYWITMMYSPVVSSSSVLGLQIYDSNLNQIGSLSWYQCRNQPADRFSLGHWAATVSTVFNHNLQYAYPMICYTGTCPFPLLPNSVVNTPAQNPIVVIPSTSTLTLTNSGNGTVTSNPSGINCGSTCTLSSLSQGTTVALTASPNTGYTTSWTGCTSTNGNMCTITINGNTSIGVTFTSSTPAQQPTQTPTQPTGASTVAASCSETDVQTAMNAATANPYTIYVPAGTCLWSSKLVITKSGITFIGGQGGKTTIQNYGFLPQTGVNNWRVSGFTFSNVNALSPGSYQGVVFDVGCIQTGASTGWSIDGNTFLNYGVGVIVACGDPHGVIANNTFSQGPTSNDSVIYVNGSGDSDWDTPSAFGTANMNVFVEDNLFLCPAGSGSCGHAFMIQNGGHAVFRCNTIQSTGSTGYFADATDNHGFGYGIGIRSTREMEAYGNHYMPKYYETSAFDLRGGSQRIFDNVIDPNPVGHVYGQGYMEVLDYRASTTSDLVAYPGKLSDGHYACDLPGAQWSPNNPHNILDNEGYPGCDQIGEGEDLPAASITATQRQQFEGTYFWGNRLSDGTPIAPNVGGGADNPIMIQLGRDFFNGVIPDGYQPYTYPYPSRDIPPQNSCLAASSLSQSNTGISFVLSGPMAPPPTQPVQQPVQTQSPTPTSTPIQTPVNPVIPTSTLPITPPSPIILTTPPVADIPELTSPTVVTPASFTRPLAWGDSGTDVLALQVFLNEHGFDIAQTGNGSPGHETTYFGPATKQAVIRFQETYAAAILSPYDLSVGTGLFGPATRNEVDTILGGTAIPFTTTPTVSATWTGSFTQILKLGSSGIQVEHLQMFLNNQGFIVAKSGNGSPGHETTYFGPATEAALDRFQVAHASTILTPLGLTKPTGVFGKGSMGVADALD